MRLKGRVDIVVGGSGWWDRKDSEQPDSPARKLNREIMKATPSRFARMLGVPVVHAAHAGNFVGQSWPDQGETYSSHYLGEAQIVDGEGRVLARMSREEGEGVITADISFGSITDQPEAIPDRYWIAEFPEAIFSGWQSALENGRGYYLSTTLPYLKRLFDRAVETGR